MIFETILGGALGGILRLAPEVLKWMDRNNERQHELAMFDKQLEADRLRSEQHLAEIQAQGQVTLDAGGLSALTEAIRGQGQMTGVPWIDGLNQSVRPFLTYWWVVVLSTAALAAQFILLLQGGTPPVEAIIQLWGPEEKTIVAGMINFWFLDRVIRKQQGV